MGFAKNETSLTLSASNVMESEKSFIPPDIPWPYFAVVVFMGVVSAFDIGVPTSVLLVLSAGVFFSLLQKSLTSPVYGLLGLVAFIPYSKAIAGNLGGMIPGMNYTTVLTVITLIGFFSTSSRLTKYPVLPLESNFRNLVLFFCLIGGFSIIHTDIVNSSFSIGSTLVSYKRWLDPILVFFLCSFLVQEEEDAKKILYMMAFTLMVIGFGTYWQRHELDEHSSYVRFIGIAGQSNTMGAFYANYSFVMIGFLVMKKVKKLHKGVILLGLIGCLLGLFATQSRGDALGFVAGMLLFFFFRNKLQFLTFIAVIIFVAFNPHFLPGGLKQRVERTIQQQSNDGFAVKKQLDASARTRLALWKGAVRMIADNPIMGVGYKMFQTFIYGYVDHNEETAGLELKGRDGHNAYLMIGAEMGLPALFVFLTILGFMFRIAWKSYRASPDLYWKTVSVCVLCSVGSLAVTNMFGSRVFSLILTGYLWALVAILLKMPRWAKERSLKKDIHETEKPKICTPSFQNFSKF